MCLCFVHKFDIIAFWAGGGAAGAGGAGAAYYSSVINEETMRLQSELLFLPTIYRTGLV